MQKKEPFQIPFQNTKLRKLNFTLYVPIIVHVYRIQLQFRNPASVEKWVEG